MRRPATARCAATSWPTAASRRRSGSVPVVMRARRAGCGRDRTEAFSCQHRGACSSCGGRRVSETAARQLDRVVRVVPHRQRVLSLRWALRPTVARGPALPNAVSRVFIGEVRAWLRVDGWRSQAARSASKPCRRVLAANLRGPRPPPDLRHRARRRRDRRLASVTLRP
jgi:hypothetical protein